MNLSMRWGSSKHPVNRRCFARPPRLVWKYHRRGNAPEAASPSSRAALNRHISAGQRIPRHPPCSPIHPPPPPPPYALHRLASSMPRIGKDARQPSGCRGRPSIGSDLRPSERGQPRGFRKRRGYQGKRAQQAYPARFSCKCISHRCLPHYRLRRRKKGGKCRECIGLDTKFHPGDGIMELRAGSLEARPACNGPVAANGGRVGEVMLSGSLIANAVLACRGRLLAAQQFAGTDRVSSQPIAAETLCAECTGVLRVT
ncbi:hypothetical protein B0H67DRAFT_295382 [Lasiosphaeris hirsuta]|uniref:Uncharacterized protein n=1 Tax=Lasiosphaeris hirsuta TaxID=260670 RepID=A0AA40DTS2_9PEZI|nr:hypothetical protein B0H67DRAFT_295382 [Lasiosphaeris hirsuta]